MFVCGNHFSAEQFSGVRTLKKTAIPDLMLVSAEISYNQLLVILTVIVIAYRSIQGLRIELKLWRNLLMRWLSKVIILFQFQLRPNSFAKVLDQWLVVYVQFLHFISMCV